MFLTLMLTNLVLATITAGAVAYLFHKPIQNIMRRVIDEQIGTAWARYMQFAILVTGISSGVRIYELERYITPLFSQPNKPAEILILTPERWVLELYRTIISTLSGITWMLLAFFVVALIAYVIVRLGELKPARTNKPVALDKSTIASAGEKAMRAMQGYQPAQSDGDVKPPPKKP